MTKPSRRSRLLSAKIDGLAEISVRGARRGSFFIGHIHAVQEDEVIIRSIDPEGRPDGLHWMEVGRIARVSFASAYLDRIRRLDSKHPRHGRVRYPRVRQRSGSLLTWLLAYAAERSCAIDLETGDGRRMSGQVDSCVDGRVALSRFDRYGRAQRPVTVEQATIRRMNADGIEEGLALWLLQHP